MDNMQARGSIHCMSKVDPKKVYTIKDIKQHGFLPWAKDTRTVRKILQSGVLKAKVTGEFNRKRYFVKGTDLQAYINHYGSALMRTARTKHGNEKRSNENDGT